jgi:hypothetical protein
MSIGTSSIMEHIKYYSCFLKISLVEINLLMHTRVCDNSHEIPPHIKYQSELHSCNAYATTQHDLPGLINYPAITHWHNIKKPLISFCTNRDMHAISFCLISSFPSCTKLLHWRHSFILNFSTIIGVNPPFHLIFYDLTSPCTVGDGRRFEGSTKKKIYSKPF